MNHPSSHRWTDLIRRFSSARVLVLGDVILDSYLNCRAVGIANEAPVPLLEVASETHAPGGAANVACNLAKLGVQTQLIGRLGDDLEGRTLSRLLSDASVQFCALTTLRQTIRKSRVLSGSHYYLRIDEEQPAPVSQNELERLSALVDRALQGVEWVIVSDYDKGLFTADSVRALEGIFLQRQVKVLADLKPQNVVWWRHLHLITPNLAEARGMYAQAGGGKGDELEVSQLASQLSAALNCHVVLKLSSEGMLVAKGGRVAAQFKALCGTPQNLSGAGDTVMATLAAALACGSPLEQAAELANLAAAIVVSREGTSAVTAEELIEKAEGLES